MVHLSVAHRTGKVMDTPRLIQGREHVARNHLVAHKAQVAEQLMVVRLTIGQPAFLVVTMAQERFLALGAHEMLDVPVLAQRRHNALLDGPSTGATNRDAHLIVTPQAVQFVQVVGRIAGTTFDFARRRVQFNAACGAIEVVAVIHFAPESQRLVIDQATARDGGAKQLAMHY